MARTSALRLTLGEDLRRGIEAHLGETRPGAAAIVAAVGSLTVAVLRFAGREDGTHLVGPFEIVSLSGTLSPDGVHVHLSVADAEGRLTGGHLLHGSIVRTTAELVILELEGVRFRREIDPATGWRELTIEGEPMERGTSGPHAGGSG